jgi:hypothetical protein
MEWPSEVENAPRLAEHLVDAGYGRPGATLEQVADDIYDKGGWRLFGRLLEGRGWRAKACNDAHVILAQFAKEGLIHWVLTTNWDLLVETAFNQTGVDHSVLVRAEDFETQPRDRPVLAKLHGCLTKPEYIKVTTKHMRSRKWLERWAEVLFEVVVRGNALLFVGYSGSSQAVTRTLKVLLKVEGRSGPDYLVDIRTLDQISGDKDGAGFASALQLGSGSDFDCGGCAFFLALRDRVFPMLLVEPLRAAGTLIDELAEPTQVDPSSVRENLHDVHQAWLAAGSTIAQTALLTAFNGFGYSAHVRPYVPMRDHVAMLALWWSWLSVALWTGSVALRENLKVEIADGGVEFVPCVCSEGARRDATALQLQAFITDRLSVPGRRFVGVVLGGTGPVPPASPVLSVARGLGTPSISRGGGAEFVWMKSDELLERFERDRTAGDIQAGVRASLGSVGSSAGE